MERGPVTGCYAVEGVVIVTEDVTDVMVAEGLGLMFLWREEVCD